jgi:hypothetical protein
MRVRRTPFLNPHPIPKPLGVTSPLAPRKSVSLDFYGGSTVLSINASNSVLSEKALQAFKYAFLRNQKIGLGCLPSNESPSQVELDKAAAAYEISRNLVDWSEQLEIDGDENLHELDSNVEEEHRSCDLKKSEHRSCEIKTDTLIGLLADTKDDSVELKKFRLESPPDFHAGVLDLKAPLPFLDDLFTSDLCEGMDFFNSPTLDDLISEKMWNGKFDRVDVDVSFGSQDATPLMHDSDNCDDLASPLSSPSSPCSPYSPGAFPSPV